MKKRVICTLRQPLKGIFTKMYYFCGVFLACVLIFATVFGGIESFASGNVYDWEGEIVPPQDDSIIEVCASDLIEINENEGGCVGEPGNEGGNFMGIMPMTNVTTWEQLRQAVNLAGNTPTRIYLMAPVINTNVGVVDSTPIRIGAEQNITLINGLPGANSRVTLMRNGAPILNNVPEESALDHIVFRMGHHFIVTGRLQLGEAGGTAQSSNITLDSHIFAAPTPGPAFVGDHTVRGGVHVGAPPAANATNWFNSAASWNIVPNALKEFVIHDGVIIQNGQHSQHGGAVRVNRGSFIMHGGILQNNYADANRGGAGNGGAVAILSPTASFVMHNGIIQNNTIAAGTTAGGGVVITAGAQFVMHDGYIRYNRVPGSSSGGGVAVLDAGGVAGNVPGFSGNSTFVMNGGTITGNQAVTNGGGVIVRSTGQAHIITPATSRFYMRAGTISHNRVTELTNPNLPGTGGNGGGVFTMNPDLGNINIGNVGGIDTSSQIHFYGNESSAFDGNPLLLYPMGVPAGRAAFPNIRWNNWLNAHNTGTTSVPEAPVHLINNWDVNMSRASHFYEVSPGVIVPGAGSNTPFRPLFRISVVTGFTPVNPFPAVSPPELLGWPVGTTGNLMTSRVIPEIDTTGTRLFALEDNSITINAGPRNPLHYTFIRWDSQPQVPWIHGVTSPTINQANIMPAHNLQIIPRWNANIYFQRNFTGAIPPLHATVAGPLSGTIGDANMPGSPSRPNGLHGPWTFHSWNTQPGGGGTAFTGATPILASIHVYAQWNGTVNFDINAPTAGPGYLATWAPGTQPPPRVIRDGQPIGPLPNQPSRQEHDFLGWYTTPAPDSDPLILCVPFGQFPNMTEGDRTYYARWRRTTRELTLVKANPQWGTATAASTTGTPTTTTANLANPTRTKDVPTTEQVTITTGLLAQFLPPTTTNNHSARFNITITQTIGAVTTTLFPTAPLNTFPSAGINFNMPTANTTVTVTVAPVGAALVLNMEAQNLHFGTHPITLTQRMISLQDGFINGNSGLNPANVRFEVFNSALTDNWRVTVAAAPGGAGCSEFYRLLRVGTTNIGLGPADAFNFTGAAAAPGNPAHLIQPFGWNDLNYEGVIIDVPPGRIARNIGTPRTAVVTWTLIVGP